MQGACDAPNFHFLSMPGVVPHILAGQIDMFRGPTAPLESMLYMLGYPPSDMLHPRTKEVQWKKMRTLFTDKLFHEMETFNPESEPPRREESHHASTTNLNRLLEGIVYDDVKKQNYPLAELLAYVTHALKFQAAAVARRAQLKAEEEERQRKAAEEAAAVQAEADAAAAAAAAAAADEPPAE